MNVLHLSLSLDGGAGVACRRLHEALPAAGVHSHVWTAHGGGVHNSTTVQPIWWRWRARWDRLPLRRYPRRDLFAWWSNNRTPGRLLGRAAARTPDIIHLHWIGDGWIHPAEIEAVGVPVVWTFHDAWPFTGGCHYPGDCERFRNGCGGCPQLRSDAADDLSAHNWQRKQRAFALANLTVVTPSRWLAQLAVHSPIFANKRIEVIANGLDPIAFAPGDREAARARFGLAPDERTLLVFVSGNVNDRRKGAALLVSALHRIGPRSKLRLLVAGGGDLAGIPAMPLGRIAEESRLVQAYRAADAVVLPSLQDNLPNTAVEALACGCPVLAFAVGGLPELVTPHNNGWLAEPTEMGLTAMISVLLDAPAAQLAVMRDRARASFLKKFTVAERAADYCRLYESAVANQSSGQGVKSLS